MDLPPIDGVRAACTPADTTLYGFSSQIPRQDQGSGQVASCIGEHARYDESFSIVLNSFLNPSPLPNCQRRSADRLR